MNLKRMIMLCDSENNVFPNFDSKEQSEKEGTRWKKKKSKKKLIFFLIAYAYGHAHSLFYGREGVNELPDLSDPLLACFGHCDNFLPFLLFFLTRALLIVLLPSTILSPSVNQWPHYLQAKRKEKTISIAYRTATRRPAYRQLPVAMALFWFYHRKSSGFKVLSSWANNKQPWYKPMML